MSKKDVSKICKALIPYLVGNIIGLVISLIVCLTSDAFTVTKEIPQVTVSGGEIIFSNITVSGISEAGNGVINILSGFLIGFGILGILIMCIDFFLIHKDGA